MPTWDNILEIVNGKAPNEIFENYVAQLSSFTNRTTICYMSAFTIPRRAVHPISHSIIDQDMQGFMTCSNDVNKDGLDLILHLPGGDSEATKRIINYLHETYSHIRVFVPHMALSGGTLIACAADEIYMGSYSSLGPTDYQILIGGNYIPIEAIIEEFEQAFEDVRKEPNKAALWLQRLNQVPFGLYKSIENTKVRSKEYLRELLKIRNCKNKNDQELESIVEFLNTQKSHSTHGSGICFKDVKGKLNVVDLRSDKDLEDKVLSIYHSAIILFEKTTIEKIIVNNKGKRYLRFS